MVFSTVWLFCIYPIFQFLLTGKGSFFVPDGIIKTSVVCPKFQHGNISERFELEG